MRMMTLAGGPIAGEHAKVLLLPPEREKEGEKRRSFNFLGWEGAAVGYFSPWCVRVSLDRRTVLPTGNQTVRVANFFQKKKKHARLYFSVAQIMHPKNKIYCKYVKQ